MYKDNKRRSVKERVFREELDQETGRLLLYYLAAWVARGSAVRYISTRLDVEFILPKVQLGQVRSMSPCPEKCSSVSTIDQNLPHSGVVITHLLSVDEAKS